MTKSFLVVGGDSMIGGALAGALSTAGRDVRVTTRRQDSAGNGRIYLDLAKPSQEWPPLPDADVWILCAGITRLKACDDDPEGSRRINVDAMTALARSGTEKGAYVLFLSSDKVFDGSLPNRPAGDEACPRTFYGKHKAEAEQNILALDGGVVRFAKVLETGSTLFANWIEALGKGEEISAFEDMAMAPVPLELAVDILIKAADRGLTGVLQVSGPRDISYAEAARHIARCLGADPVLVRGTTARSAGISGEQTPPHSSLDTHRLESELGIRIPDAFDVLEDLFELPKPGRGK